MPGLEGPTHPRCRSSLPLQGRSQTVTGDPAERSILFNLPSAKNASERPSGDQNGDAAPSVPFRGRASRSVIARTQMRLTPVSSGSDSVEARNANCDPSGDNAKNVSAGLKVKKPPSGGDTSKRTGGAVRLRVADGRYSTMPSTAAKASVLAIDTPATRRVNDRAGTWAMAVPSPLSSAIRASPISRSRSFGSLVRQRRRTRTRFAGVPARSRSQSGSRSITAACASLIVAPANGGWCAHISNRTQPNAQMSVRLSTGWPRACSGLM